MAYSQRPTLGATRARQGRFGRHVVWVLLFSTLLAALALFGAWTWKSGDLASSNSNNGPSAAGKSYDAPAPAANVQQGRETSTTPNPQ
jgi:hypothetical protein